VRREETVAEQEDYESLEYSVSIVDWTALNLTLYFNFSDPSLVSRGQENDLLICKFKKASMFVQKDSGMNLASENTTYVFLVPSQLP